MADRYKILYGDATVTIRRECPSNLPLITAVKGTVVDDAGTAIQAAASATVPTATTLSAAITAGAAGGTMATAQPWVEGDLLQFGAAAEGVERRRIATYNSTTGVFTTTERFNNAHASGGAVAACWWTLAVDATATGFDNLERGTILWDTITPDTVPFTDEFIVVKRQAAPAAVRSKFSTRFPHINQLAADFGTEQWEQLENDAADRVRLDLAAKGRNVDNLADSGKLDEPHMLMAAYLLALGADSEYADELTRLRDDYNDRIEMLVASPFWEDSDQDSVRDEDEDADAQAPYFMGRGL